MITSDDTQALLTKLTGLTEGKGFDQSIKIIIKEICQYAEWPYGEAWMPGVDKKQLGFSAVWNNHKFLFEEFEKFSSICKFAKGIGLVGKVWEKEALIRDKQLSIASDFLRYDVARRAGITAGVGFFININKELPCVFTFFMVGDNPDDEKKIDLIAKISHDIGTLLSEKLK